MAVIGWRQFAKALVNNRHPVPNPLTFPLALLGQFYVMLGTALPGRYEKQNTYGLTLLGSLLILATLGAVMLSVYQCKEQRGKR